MQRKLWQPCDRLRLLAADDNINFDNIPKHCGNCRFGMLNHRQYYKLKERNFKGSLPLSFGCHFNAQVACNGTVAQVTSLCSGETRKYPKKVINLK